MKITKEKANGFVNNCLSFKGLIALCTVGIWLLVLQNFGIIPMTQNVTVKGGYVGVSGGVSIDNTVDVRGSVDVDNTVDVNLSEINGYSDCFYNNYSKHPNKYYRIPVYNNY